MPPTPLVYSSQNVEAPLKLQLAPQYLDVATARKIAGEVEAIERELVRNADHVIAVSERDAAVYRDWGSRAVDVVPNGTSWRAPSATHLEHWRSELEARGIRRHVLFVGSAHVPNLQGFSKMLGTHLGFLPPDAAIVVVGNVSGMIANDPALSAALPRSRMLLLPQATDDDLSALIELSQAVLLPIMEGGGTNLKTVEALFSGRPIVATSFAFRGYEAFADGPGIIFRDVPEAFQGATRDRILGERQHSRPARPELQAFSWDNLGDRFVALVRERLEGRVASPSNRASVSGSVAA